MELGKTLATSVRGHILKGRSKADGDAAAADPKLSPLNPSTAALLDLYLADELPENLMRKLSEAEIAKKKEDIVRRNAELEENYSKKDTLFAEARGTAETREEHIEKRVRQEFAQRKVRDADDDHMRKVAR